MKHILGLFLILCITLSCSYQEKKEKDGEGCTNLVTDGYNCQGERILCGDGICKEDPEESICPQDCVPKEKFSVLSNGRFSVIVPKGYELLAEKNLEDLQHCYPLIKEFLGIEPFHKKTYLKIEISTTGENRGFSDMVGINYLRSPENIDMDLKEVQTNNSEGFLYRSSLDYCANTHEFVHVFVGHLQLLPDWANEGIAEYTQKHIQNGSKDHFECRDDGWYGKDFWGDNKEKQFPFSDLDTELYENGGYRTALCFWEFVDTNYGRESIPKIFQLFDRRIQENTFRGNFVDEILVPVLGEEIRGILREKYGIEK